VGEVQGIDVWSMGCGWSVARTGQGLLGGLLCWLYAGKLVISGRF